MKILSAQDARRLSEDNKSYSPLFKQLMYHIEDVAKTGDTFTYFQTDGKRLSDDEIIKLRKDLKYNILWNGPCLWYEISW